MGQAASCCAGNVFKQLYEKYGDTFVKLMVAEKGKDVVRDEFGKIRQQSQDIFGTMTKDTTNITDGKINELTKVYQGVKQKVGAVPGALDMIQKSQGRPIDQISGFNALKGQMKGVQQSTLGRISNEYNNIMTKMNRTQDDMITNIEKQRPRIDMYEELPEPVQRVVRQKAEQEFASQLSQNKQQIIQMIASQFNLGNISQLFGQIGPENQLNGILNGAGGQFLSKLSGGGLGGGLGGIGQQFGIGGGNSGKGFGGFF